MPDIKIYGKLVNKSSDGIVADASQIMDGAATVSTKLEELENNKLNSADISTYLSDYSTIDSLTGKLVNKYESEENAKSDLINLNYGDIISVRSESALYNTNYDSYIVIENAAGEKDIKVMASGSGDSGGGSTLSITLEEVNTILDGTDKTYSAIENNDIIECDLNTKVTFKYTFISSNYPDSRGTVYFKNGSTTLTSQSVYPRDSAVYSWVYDTATLPEAGTYTIQLYGIEATGKTTGRKTIRLRVGSLSVSSKFNADEVLRVNNRITFGPLAITSADNTAELTAHLLFDDTEVLTQSVTTTTTALMIPAEYATEGSHTISLYITSLSDGNTKVSNTISYNVIIARDGELYTSLDKNLYEYQDGSKIRFGLRVIMLGGEENRYIASLNIRDTDNNLVKENLSYTVGFGINNIDITNVGFNPLNYEVIGGIKYTLYTAEFSVSTDDPVNPIIKNITANIRISENEYNISTLANDALICEFVSDGKSNSSINRAIWEDSSGNGITTTFNNFNWSTNGWLEDDESNTALVLNSGAYVEIDLAPFAREINTGLTISIDFSTKDILDSNAKVASCLYETDGTDINYYYLRDAYGNYVLDDTTLAAPLPTTDANDEIIRTNVDSNGNALNANNLVRYFQYAGGYCWVDGQTYQANGLMNGNGDLPYSASENVSDRIINYNLGIINDAYNNPADPEAYDQTKEIEYRKCTGYTLESVTKQTGFYIDTKYAVLTNSASPANIDDKFHLYFSEDTRTKIDLIITRSTDAPYYFNSMIGYTNGCISLMQQITNNNKFQTGTDSSAGNYKIYLGAKGIYDANDRFTGVTDTGECKIYSFRIYNRALTPDEVLVNYAAGIPSTSQYLPTTGGTPTSIKENVIRNNGINKNGTFDNSIMPHVMQAILYSKDFNSEPSLNHFIMQLSNGTGIADLKKIREPAYIQIYDENGDPWTYSQTKNDGTVITGRTTIPIRLQFQGTSSLVYPMKNYKWKCYSADYDPISKEYGAIDDDGILLAKKQKLKFNLGNGFKEQTFCFKADYMDSSHCNNTGTANFIADYNEVTGPTPAQKINPSCRTTVYGKPCLLFYVDENGIQHSLGVGNLNIDKSDNGSFGLDNKIEDVNGIEFEFEQKPYIDDEFNSDILTRSEITDTSDLVDGDSMNIYFNNRQEIGTLQLRNGVVVGVKASNDKVYEVREPIVTSYSKETETRYYVVLKNPRSGVINALLTEKGYLRSIDNVKMVTTQCSEFKANSGAAGAGGFGNYQISSIAADTELRYVDDGDLENEEYSEYVSTVGKNNAISYNEYRNPRYYCLQRMIKWVSTASEEEFKNNLDKHFNRNYLLDYYLTIMLIGGVDSLGKNLMMATWGPENYLYEITAEEAQNDQLSFEYTSNGITRYFTPTITPTMLDGVKKYIFAKDAITGLNLYYSEDEFSRATNTWNGIKRTVSTVPGDYIWYPIFYDIDTIGGLDNSGQLLFDVDIELADKLDDGTSVFNTNNSHLWSRVANYLGGLNSVLATRWSELRTQKGTGELAKFSEENLIKHFYYENQISKIPERYYNNDAIIKYIQEGPFAPGEIIGGTTTPATVGSGSYLYCIHGSRYEQIKHWFSQRISYLDSMFSPGADTAASLRFNHSKYDANYDDTETYYANLATLAVNQPSLYEYDSLTNRLYAAGSNKLLEILPINFNFKTYQPGYVGIKWFNGGIIHMIRVKRDKTTTITGNVKTSGDAEVFIYGGSNIKEIGDMYKYNVKQVDFKNLNKLNKLVLGASGFTCVINKLDLGTNSYLSNLQLVNCTSLTSVDVSTCINLKSINMTGSSITNITLPPNGGALESISYSSKVTSINLNNFTNLTTITVPLLDNLTEFIIKDCPKVLGSMSSETAVVWNLLQRTNKASGLKTVNINSYGTAEPLLLSGGGEFFFADKYYSLSTARNITGLVRYTGTVVPSNYTKFESSFPGLTITYSNITDASEMFANYNNINLIGTITVVTGRDIYGKDLTRTVYYWKDETPYLQEKWHNATMYAKYGYTSTYSTDTKYYYSEVSGNMIYYRLLGIYDDEDLDMLRAEIKKNVSSFRRFTNVSGMFRNMEILDYLDPDTFNNIDLSSAVTDEMFAGCTNLRYFIMPNDTVKNELRTRYFDNNGDLVSQSDLEEGKEYTSEQYYWDPISETEVETALSIHPKGIRSFGNNMFYNCKKVRVYIRKLSNSDKIIISPTAFAYSFYDPSKTVQSPDVTVERPVVCFEHSKAEILTTTSNPTETYLVGGEDVTYYNDEVSEGLYLFTDYNKNHTINYANNYIIFNSASWLRECYFGVTDFILGETTRVVDGITYPCYSGELTEDDAYSLFYANTADGKVLFNVINESGSSLFNKKNSSTTYFKNIYNIMSVTVGAFRNLVNSNTTDYQFPLFVYEYFDTINDQYDSERSVLSYFIEDKYFSIDTLSTLIPANLMEIDIIETKVIPSLAFKNFLNIRIIGLSKDVEEISDGAFMNFNSLENVTFGTYLFINTADEGSEYTTLTKIGDSAFENCTSLKSFNIPNSVTSFGTNVFRNCTALTSIDYSTSLTIIPEGTFYDCKLLTSLSDFSENITIIDAEAFYGCKALPLFNEYRNIIFNESTTRKSFDYFKNLEYIGDRAFRNVKAYSTTYFYSIFAASHLREGDARIGNYKNYAKLIFPASMSYIGTDAFRLDSSDKATDDYQKTEFIWKSDNYASLTIGNNAFSGLIPAWAVEIYNNEDYYDAKFNEIRLLDNVIYVPNIGNGSLGSNIFTADNKAKQFTLAVTRTSDDIGSHWVNYVKKFIFSYNGICDTTFDANQNSTARYILSSSSLGNYAYLQTAYTPSMSISIPTSIIYEGEQYIVRQILSGAFDSISSISSIIFQSDSQLELIESEVLTTSNASNLSLVMTGASMATIPATLTIETGNDLSSYANILSLIDSSGISKFITLGRYILGYVLEETTSTNIIDSNGTLFFSSITATCDTIFDSAFENKRDFTKVDLTGIQYIYEKAFMNSSLDYSSEPFELSEGLLDINSNAFRNVVISHLIYPTTIRYIADGAFSTSSATGGLRTVEFKEGLTNLDSHSVPFNVPNEIRTGIGTPSTANITLNTLYLPHGTEFILNNSFAQFNQLSQIVNLYVGYLLKDPTYGYLVENNPLYFEDDGEGNPASTITKTTTPHLATNSLGQRLYSYKFYDLIVNTSNNSYYANSYIETTDERSICPVGDYLDGNDNMHLGFIPLDNMLDLSYIKAYPDAEFQRGVDEGIVTIPSEGFSGIQILMILAGLSANAACTVRITESQYSLINNYITPLLILGKFGLDIIKG